MTLTIKDRKRILLELQNGKDFNKFSRKVRDDFEICYSVAKKFYYDFQFISTRLKNDKDFVMALMNDSCTNIFEYLSEELRDDEDIFMIVFVNEYPYGRNENFFKLVSSRIRNNNVLIRKYLRTNPNLSTIYPYLSNEIQHDSVVLRRYIKRTPQNYVLLPEKVMRKHSTIALVLYESPRILFKNILDNTMPSQKFRVWAMSPEFTKWRNSIEPYNIYMFKRNVRIIGRLKCIFNRYAEERYHPDNKKNSDLQTAKKRFKKQKYN